MDTVIKFFQNNKNLFNKLCIKYGTDKGFNNFGITEKLEFEKIKTILIIVIHILIVNFIMINFLIIERK